MARNLVVDTEEQAESLGVERDLIRFSIGLEVTSELAATFERALAAVDEKDSTVGKGHGV